MADSGRVIDRKAPGRQPISAVVAVTCRAGGWDAEVSAASAARQLRRSVQQHSDQQWVFVESQSLSTVHDDRDELFTWAQNMAAGQLNLPHTNKNRKKTRSTVTRWHCIPPQSCVQIRIHIQIRDPDCHQNLIICSLAHCQPLKISCKSIPKFLRKVATNR